MKIEFDTANISELDRRVLSAILGTPLHPEVAAALVSDADRHAEQSAPVKAKRAPKAAPTPEPEVPTSEEAGDTGSPADEDLLAPEDPATPEAPAQPTMQDAVAAATPLIAGGKQDQVKAILEGLGVKRVSSLSEDQIPAFLDGISAL